jgi:NADH:ubiquinone oxidoreductase subunit 6 (subunit J)
MPSLLAEYLPILLPSVLGLVAVYLLLPRARRFPPLYGAVAGALALLAAGWLLIRPEWNTVETMLFYLFAGLAIIFGGLMITQRNPVHAALSFAMVVLSTCGLFLLQAAPFLMAATIIIYAGAIVVTFLFVIMLAQQAGLSSADQRSREPFLATVAGFVLLASLLSLLHKSYSDPRADSFTSFMMPAERAAQMRTVKDWQTIFGDDDRYFTEFRHFIDPPGIPQKPDPQRRALSDAIQNAQVLWSALRPFEDGQAREESAEMKAEFKKELDKVSQLAGRVRQSQGSLIPAKELPLSTSAGSSPNAVAEFKDGKLTERLPAANVAGLGRALFTDYLLSVELAGTLLLVATIGAIAIAGRRSEGLR